jgi:hypothetical protein
MRIRTAALVGGWALALGLATAVSWAGVNLVGAEVSPSGSVPLSQAEVERRIHAAAASAGAPSVSASTTPSPGAVASTPGAAGTPVQQSVVVQGGTVVLVCAGDRVTAKTSPRAGYTVSEDSRVEGAAIQVTFDDGSHRSQVDGRCQSGAPTAKVRESDHNPDD